MISQFGQCDACLYTEIRHRLLEMILAGDIRSLVKKRRKKEKRNGMRLWHDEWHRENKCHQNTDFGCQELNASVNKHVIKMSSGAEVKK